MELPTKSEVWAWYKQFSHDPLEMDRRMSRNFFRRIDPSEIARFKNEFGPVLPESYEKFLLEIGCGYIKEDINSKITITYANEFLELSEIAAIMRKETEEWDIYPDFIKDDEVPFFSVGGNSVYVFDKYSSPIHFPLKGRKFADSLDEFLRKLMLDCEFYTQR